jgi:hypothetical protein
MDTALLIILWVVILGIVVALLAWFGPRPSQWRSREGKDQAEPNEVDTEPGQQ